MFAGAGCKAPVEFFRKAPSPRRARGFRRDEGSVDPGGSRVKKHQRRHAAAAVLAAFSLLVSR
jgi:hypothetical protein